MSPSRTLCSLLALALTALAACGDEGGGGRDTVGADGETSIPLEDALTSDEIEAADAAQDGEEDAEILYPGNSCGGDDQCSTGLCYGLASAQGHFEKPKCQSLCLELNDFMRYCDSDDDCCKGRCCTGCGAREGLCVLD